MSMSRTKNIVRKLIALLLLIVPILIFGQNENPIPMPRIQFFAGSTGNPLSNGIVCTYAAGTTTPLATFTDSTGGTPNPTCASPGVGGIALDAAGSANIWIPRNTLYKFVVYNASAVQQYSVDNVSVQAGYLGDNNTFTGSNTFTGTTIGPFTDKGGAVFSVKAYGATGNGVTDDTISINNAIAAAQGIGTVYFPRGSYNISSTLTTLTAGTNFRGEGPAISQIFATTPLTPMVQVNSVYNGTTTNEITGLSFLCNNTGPANGSGRQGTGILQLDTTDAYYHNNSFFHCTQGIELRNNARFSERNLFDNIVLQNNATGILFNFVSGGAGTNSFEHNVFTSIKYNLYNAGDRVVTICPSGTCTGGYPAVSNCKFELYGNIPGNNAAAIFDLSGGQNIIQSSFVIAIDNAGGAQGSVFFTSSDGAVNNQCTSHHACVLSSTGTILENALTALTGGAGTFQLIDLTAGFGATMGKRSIEFAGTFTSTAAASDVVTISPPVVNSNSCWVVPTNATAAGMIVNTYVSAIANNSITVTHPVTANGNFSILCM